MPVATFTESEEIRRVAEELIDKYHPHLADAKEYIGYFFREGGQVAWKAKVNKNNPFISKLAKGKMITVFVVRGDWEEWDMEIKMAELDHVLCHVTRASAGKITNEEGKVIESFEDPEDPANWKIRRHDVEDFSSVIERHGLYYNGLERFAEIARNAPHQMTIIDAERETGEDC